MLDTLTLQTTSTFPTVITIIYTVLLSFALSTLEKVSYLFVKEKSLKLPAKDKTSLSQCPIKLSFIAVNLIFF